MRRTCPQCFRPDALCLCPLLPRIHNRTHVLVLQHPRERFHPFGSARMLMAALANGRMEVVVGEPGKSLHQPVPVPPDTGLLYPHPSARQLSSLAPDERPKTLLLLDGTWAHAKRLYDDNRWLHDLPHFAISPARKSRYLVRLEPHKWCLSTLEAAVEALGCLEPETAGLDKLLAVFERMNTDQVTRRAQAPQTARVPRRSGRPARTLDPDLTRRSGDLVLVHAENAEVALRTSPERTELFYGAALRAFGSERWFGFVRPPRGEPTDAALKRSQLRRADIERLLSRDQFTQQLRAFLRPDDVVVAWNRSMFKLLPAEVLAGHPLLQLKAVYCNWYRGAAGTLAEAVARHRLSAPPARVPGRLGEHLAHMQALTAFLQDAASEAAATDGRGPSASILGHV